MSCSLKSYLVLFLIDMCIVNSIMLNKIMFGSKYLLLWSFGSLGKSVSLHLGYLGLGQLSH
jgi:hypothetical protein